MSVAVVELGDKGRGVVCQTALQPGCLVLSLPPFQAVLYDEHLTSHCSYALRACSTTFRCAQCKTLRYGSQAAQKKDWKRGHREECACLVASSAPVTATIRLAARVIWAHQREAAGSSQDWNDLLALRSHWQDLPDARRVMFAQMAVVTRLFMQSAGGAVALSNREIAELLARFACNNHTVCDDELRPVGVGIYPFAALLNHSCRPNCCQSFVDGAIVIRAVGDIPAGDELTLSYIELAATSLERRRVLTSSYYFDPHPSAPALRDIPVAKSQEEAHASYFLTTASLCLNELDQQLCLLAPPTQPSRELDRVAHLPTDRQAETEHAALYCWGQLSFRDSNEPSQLEHSTAQDERSEHLDGLMLALGQGLTVASDHGSCSASRSVLEAIASDPSFGEFNDAWAVQMVEDGWRADVWCWGGWKPQDRAWAVAAARVAYVLASTKWAQHAQSHGWGRVAETLLRRALQCAAAAGLPHGHVLVVRSLEALQRCCIDNGSDLQEAYRCACALLPSYRAVYPAVWPTVALHLATLTRLANALELDKETLLHGKQALDVLQYTHGEGAVVQSVRQALFECYSSAARQEPR